MSTVPSNTDELLEQTAAASRALGTDPFMVLHGGGNTSVKTHDFLWAKASGHDLGTLEPEGLVQLRRHDLAELLSRDELSDTEMMDGYAAATVQPGMPAPTIEALVHHALPFVSVLHSHADAIVTLTDTVHGMQLVVDVFGDDVVPVPYVMPGFELAKLAPRLWNEAQGVGSGSGPRAMVLQHHGLFTMGDTVAEALALHRELVQRAEDYLTATASTIRVQFTSAVSALDGSESSAARTILDQLNEHSRDEVAVLRCFDEEVREFMARADLAELTSRGPTTLEHVIRTKRVPLIGDDVAGYVEEYRDYFERNRRTHSAGETLIMLDPIPRVILHPELGLLTAGANEKAAHAVMDIYRHTIRVMTAAERLGGYRTLSEAQAFGLEYWELEQRRLK